MQRSETHPHMSTHQAASAAPATQLGSCSEADGLTPRSVLQTNAMSEHCVIVNERQYEAQELAAMADRLELSGDYKILRRLVPRPLSLSLASPCPDSSETGIIVDLETTGLDHGKDEVIEIAMVKFRFDQDGTIAGVADSLQAFHQPSIPIPPAITKLTGITDAMVVGQAIDAAEVDAFIANARIVIAHNAAFDRKFAERISAAFEHKPWACSASEIEWRDHGFSGAKLTYLVAEAGFFYGAHRAIDDCHAVVELLARQLPATSATALSALLGRARCNTWRIWAEHSPYDLKDHLKRRGYRWNDGADGSLRCWYVDVDAEKRDAEIKFLHREIYQREVSLRCVEFSALDRFSERMSASRT